ncbi:MAG: hypothetical protein AAFN93_14545 [Bacteroidota bacterium]
MKKLILDTPYFTCELDESIPVLKHKWLQAPPDEVFKNGLIEILGEYRKVKGGYKDLKWLADTKLLGELSEEVEQWLVSEWNHMIFDEVGVKVHAVILGSDIFADFPMEKFKMSSEKKFQHQGVKLGVFGDNEQAYDWLKQN